MDMDLTILAARLQDALDTPVTVEYPGFLFVTLADGGTLAVGNANDTWTADYYRTSQTLIEGDQPDHIIVTDVASDATDDAAIALALAAAIAGWDEKRDDRVVARLADAFDDLLQADLGPAWYAEAIALNKTETNAGVCHSHDHCDANMVMAAAFEQVLKREPNLGDLDGDDTADVNLWNAAWDLWVVRNGGAR